MTTTNTQDAIPTTATTIATPNDSTAPTESTHAGESKNNSYGPLSKAILTPQQLVQFHESPTHAVLLAYITRLNEASTGVKLRDPCTESEAVKAILDVLDGVEALVKETPPVDNKGSRFGNPAFKELYDKIKTSSRELHTRIPNLPPDAIEELAGYFEEVWGNRTRIDYGSGMELNFLCWLLCLDHLGVLTKEDDVAIVMRVFWRYIGVMRVLQSTYWLEPAGSHGVWGLDDYHFLPFLFGSAQLKGHRHLRPKSIHDQEILEEFGKDYMYLACIQFINSVKTASLRWHSPMLDDISAVKTWDKVNSGMLKMYQAEVLGKLPVMQHFLFGSILPYTGDRIPTTETHTDGHDHAHCGHNHGGGGGGGGMDIGGERRIHPKVNPDNLKPHQSGDENGAAGQGTVGWGDCCGIPVPSVFGAAAAAAGNTGKPGSSSSTGKLLQGPAIRPVPFD
ncbi:Serine/threonine-protein phosphatase 2A activator 2 [Serendipita sp. 400]|nr:Serine/threonine-protein phosphatase 2A activator 2 [Serendipita sp. 400]